MVDADNLPFDRRSQVGHPGNKLLNDNALHKGIHFGQISFGKGLIDDGDGESAGGVLFRERAALEHADAKGAEVFRCDHIEARAGTRRRIINGLSSKIEGHAKVRADDRHAGGSRNCGDARKGANLIQKLAVEGDHLFRALEMLVGHRQKKRQDVVLPESQIHAGQFPETMNHQAGPGEERESQRKLDDHQGAPQAVPPRARRSPSGFL